MPKDIARFQTAFNDITPDPEFNSRSVLTDIEGLADSLEAEGLLMPMTVREGGPARTGEGKRKLFLVSGYRRHAAITLLRNRKPGSWAMVEVKLVKGNAKELLLKNYAENAQRESLPPLDDARRLKKLMTEYGYSQSDLATAIHKPKSYISQRLALLKEGSEAVAAALESGQLNTSSAREIATLPAGPQQEVIEKIAEREKTTGRKATAVEVKEEVDKKKEKLGIKRDRKPNNAPEVDKEKLALYREHYGDRDGKPLKVIQIKELLAAEVSKLERAKTDESKQGCKTVIATLERVLGFRQ